MKTKTEKKEKTADRWKAIRRGHIYCAPVCGGNCTWVEYQKAKRKAEELAKRMGPGWEPHVWENLGWHCKVVGYGGRANIHFNEGRNYTAFLSKKPSIGGDWVESAETPEKALAIVLGMARAEFNELAQIFIHVTRGRAARRLKSKITSPHLTQALKALLTP